MPPVSVAVPAVEVASRSSLRIQSFDPGAMRVALQDGALEHLQLGSGVFQGIVTHSATNRLRTDWGRYNLPVQARGRLAHDMLTVGVLIGGAGAWRIQGAPAVSGDMVLLPEGAEVLMNLPAEAEWFAMQVPRERLDAAGIPLSGLRGAAAWRMSETQGSGGCGCLTDVAPILAPLEDAPAVAGFQIEMAQEQLFTTLLCEWEQRRTRPGRAAEKLGPSDRWRVMRRAEEYIDAHLGIALRIDSLCIAAGTSITTLERVFREVFGVTPRRYLTLRRLAGTRNDLLNGDPGESITEVAMRWGFFHLGRFAQEYGQLYNERPSQTRSGR
ncbi:helix-turn-helix transcriptional regulator [Variovorax humicola]|uniref:Helix-turn-helix transcriptional regulator n=1 Tax=Variovorax humicola TaxID=1769758 RepID=A0ABU8W7L4_9BURK